MERIRSALARRKVDEEEYVRLPGEEGQESEDVTEGGAEVLPSMSWLEYSIFALIGVAMLWAWYVKFRLSRCRNSPSDHMVCVCVLTCAERNMFLAAAPYFQKRFQGDEWILQNFQSGILSASTVTNLSSLFILTYMQKNASYSFRICAALIINIGAFTLLTVSTSYFLDVSAMTYFAFLLLMVGGSSVATGLIQNGAFAFAASFGRPEYTQALMVGQGLAGVLPAVAEIVSVLAVPASTNADAQAGAEAPPPQEGATSAFCYFLTAVIISVAAFAAFMPLVQRQRALVEYRAVNRLAAGPTATLGEAGQDADAHAGARTVVSIPALASKLRWPAAAVFTCFAVTMFYPVFAVKILSVHPTDAGRLFEPATFIPLAFFFWNLGDLTGRVLTMLPFQVRDRPVILFALAVARTVFLPLFLLCNVGGRGAFVSSDFFYLFVVQLLFGVTNGWIGASSMMAANEWADEREREVAGGFMGLCLVSGLAVGSVLSFTAAGI
jgi:equilibrative nucleoside transporter 1/2/3